ncbi:hypothetical protein OSSY52_13360 [Tepiditoga spiralis]|uniref:histidine kinase n=1 Tax=Tepiditoga spiralis TaxID=2108365 RepID=A0A7G1G511_9BACT|nr:HAMP domain-containing sensor histidine kinase [Tepiditoga spiralis]BBE31195.1 hypothetical protein OSSY52_13360 [Tepiditoga spiralis]
MKKWIIFVLIFMIFFYVLFVYLYEKNSIDENNKMVKQYANTLELSLWAIDDESIKKIVDTIISSKKVSYIKIYDESTNIIYKKQKKVNKIPFITREKNFITSINHNDVFLGKIEVTYINTNNLIYLYVFLLLLLFYFIIHLNFKFFQNNLKLKFEIKKRIKIENELQKTYKDLNIAYNNLKVAQSQLIETEKMAALGNLVAGVAHEINTPVGISLTAVSLIKEKSKEIKSEYASNKIKKSEFEEFLNIIAESSLIAESNLNKAAKLVKSFKNVAVDRMSEEKRRFNLKSYIEDVLLSLHTKYKHKNIKINIDIDDKIFINSYPGLFSQIITNFVINSILHGFEKRNSGVINIFAERKGNKLKLIYEDNGIGIKKENMKKIFEPFYTTKRGKGGSGLGLNIVYNIVTQKFNGNITCESNNGTKFIIFIPLGAEKND